MQSDCLFSHVFALFDKFGAAVCSPIVFSPIFAFVDKFGAAVCSPIVFFTDFYTF